MHLTNLSIYLSIFYLSIYLSIYLQGKVVKQFLDRVVRKRAGKLPTFVLAVGDDTDDDDVFQVSTILSL
jgi:trehalose-6-phosphatase